MLCSGYCFCFCGFPWFCYVLSFGLSFCFFVFLWRVEGSGEVAQRATSLGPKASLFVLFCFFVYFLFAFLFVGFCFVSVLAFVFWKDLRVR